MIFTPAELVSGPFSNIKFPFKVNPLFGNERPFTERFEMVLVLFCCVVPLNIIRSPLTGAAPPQLAGVFQLASVPRPLQVLVAANDDEIKPQRFSARMSGRACLMGVRILMAKVVLESL